MDWGKIDAQLEAWDTRIEGLAAKAEKARGQAAIDLYYQVDDLKARRAMALAKLDEFKAAKDRDQESIKTGLRIAWDDLEKAFKDLGL